MAVSSTYYLDAVDLASAVSVYLNSSLTILAPDGFYSDGTISREQSLGILLSEEICDCGGSLELSYRSNPGSDTYVASNLPNSSCELLAPDEPFYIFGTPCAVQNGDIACNTNDISDTFDGLNKYYKVYFGICPSGSEEYICQIDGFGVITIMENCPLPPP
jgi:hypothetical protein